MPLDKMNMYWNQQAMPQQNQFFQSPAVQGHLGGGNYTQLFGQSLQGFPPTMGNQGIFPRQPDFGRTINGLGGGMPRAQGMLSGNPVWGAGSQNAGGQGYITPGYPPQSFGQQQPQHPLQPAHVYPSQGNAFQGYAPQVYNPGHGGQMPLQAAWEEPKKGGIKGFLSNLMAKWKR